MKWEPSKCDQPEVNLSERPRAPDPAEVDWGDLAERAASYHPPQEAFLATAESERPTGELDSTLKELLTMLKELRNERAQEASEQGARAPPASAPPPDPLFANGVPLIARVGHRLNPPPG